MSRPTLGELEVIHHIDSVLAILLAMDLFLFGIVLQVIQPPRLAPAILTAGFLVVITILPGVVGILMRDWTLKLTSWFFVILSIIYNYFWVILRQYGVVYWGPVPFYASELAILLSYVIVRYVVLHAYLTRLSFVVDGATLNEYRLKLMNSCKWFRLVAVMMLIAMSLIF